MDWVADMDWGGGNRYGCGVGDMTHYLKCKSRHKRRGLGIEMGEGVVWLYQLWQFP